MFDENSITDTILDFITNCNSYLFYLLSILSFVAEGNGNVTLEKNVTIECSAYRPIISNILNDF